MDIPSDSSNVSSDTKVDATQLDDTKNPLPDNANSTSLERRESRGGISYYIEADYQGGLMDKTKYVPYDGCTKFSMRKHAQSIQVYFGAEQDSNRTLKVRTDENCHDPSSTTVYEAGNHCVGGVGIHSVSWENARTQDHPSARDLSDVEHSAETSSEETNSAGLERRDMNAWVGISENDWCRGNAVGKQPKIRKGDCVKFSKDKDASRVIVDFGGVQPQEDYL